MLVLSRKINQAIIIDNNIEVKILGADGYGGWRIGINAPDHIEILREELINKGNKDIKNELN